MYERVTDSIARKGAGPGRITLYKGRTVVERNIPQEEALDRLVELIKKNGDWTPA